MNFRVYCIHMPEGSGREHHGFLVQNFRGRDSPVCRRKTDSFSETRPRQVHQQRAAVPSLKRGSTEVYIVNFDSFLQPLCETLEERFLSLELMETCINQVHAENANGFLLERVGRIPHVDVQHDVV